MKFKILWVDDEIDLLKPHIIFLEKKDYTVHTATNGVDALEMIQNEHYDIVFLDENMTGLSGLETLLKIKEIKRNIPVIMITKSEEENLMEEAIGNQISGYLIKPVNPNQILLSLKQNLDHSRLVQETMSMNYQQEFRKISMELMEMRTAADWIKMYKKIIHWELSLENVSGDDMLQILINQKQEANSLFFKYIKNNYKELLQSGEVLFPHDLIRKTVVPLVNDKPVLLLVLDNIRYDQFRVMETEINKVYRKEQEYDYFSILPTATQYARNAMFSGMTPLEMSRRYPKWWKNDLDEGGKNLHEEDFMNDLIARLRLDIKHKYYKIVQLKDGRKLVDEFHSLKDVNLLAVVVNFVDMISHAKTEMNLIKELTYDDKAYRSLTQSWFLNSPVKELINKAAEAGMHMILTTDHGTINVKNPTKIIGPRDISANLRYKTGKGLSYEEKNVYAVDRPEEIQLPQVALNAPYVFAKENYFFTYPNNYNHYVKYYKDTYQHGGISMEEMIVPCVRYSPKK